MWTLSEMVMVLAAVSLCSACGGATTTDGGGGSAGGGGQGGAGQPNADCVALCGEPALGCEGPDTEDGSATVGDATATGCTVSVELPYSGSYTVELDCAVGQACVTAGEPSCIGAPGECYPATFETTSFSYHLPNCAHGSLSCSLPP